MGNLQEKKYRIGIMTMHCVPNYGAIMQSYATVEYIKHILKKRGIYNVEVELLDYQPLIKKRKYSLSALGCYSIFHISSLKENVRLLIQRNNRKLSKELHTLAYSFYHCNTCISGMVTKSDLKSFAKKYDAILIGSDQVWNPSGMREDLSYLLDFYDGKKFALSSSFGVSSFPTKYLENYKALLSRFDAVTTREMEGAKIFKELTGREASDVTIDPSMLLDVEQYKSIESKEIYKENSGNYSLVYMAMQSTSLLEFAVSNEGSEKRIVVCGMPDVVSGLSDTHFYDVIKVMSPESFLGLIDGADSVYTNSFHGIAFSLLYRKQLWIEYNDCFSKSNSRLENIVRTFGLEDRLISFCDLQHPYKEIDYLIIDEVLQQERDKMEKYISDIFLRL